MDEAHFLSKWEHDFRPDYRYVARYIAENHGEDSAPILCLTATARHDVVDDIREHFERTLESRLKVLDDGTERTNLEFVVMPTSTSQRIEHIHRALENALEREGSGGAIVYCTTKRSTEETAQAFADSGLIAQHFHFGLSPEQKREIKRGFHDGDIDVVVATNAFGMESTNTAAQPVHMVRFTEFPSVHGARVPSTSWHIPFTGALLRHGSRMRRSSQASQVHSGRDRAPCPHVIRPQEVVAHYRLSRLPAYRARLRGADSALAMAAGQMVDLHVLHDPTAIPQRPMHAAPAIGGEIASISYWALAMETVQVPSETRCASPLTPESVSRSRPTPYE